MNVCFLTLQKLEEEESEFLKNHTILNTLQSTVDAKGGKGYKETKFQREIRYASVEKTEFLTSEFFLTLSSGWKRVSIILSKGKLEQILILPACGLESDKDITLHIQSLQPGTVPWEHAIFSG